uniref:Uncharacterized protein n=1 Tax=Candidatus Kentrum sp. TC TaxID=2126339 RepID=A0A450YMK2_9GAMM|nr:MAG: protein of unknown function DUF29 [Candidatus Kentron sp. TC]
MGKRERRELVSRLEVLLAHLLKWKYQPAFRERSWEFTIEEQRKGNYALDSEAKQMRLDYISRIKDGMVFQYVRIANLLKSQLVKVQELVITGVMNAEKNLRLELVLYLSVLIFHYTNGYSPCT